MQTIILGIIGPMQIALIILLALVLFGGAKLPTLAKNLGKSINEFKKATKSDPDDSTDTPKDTKDKSE